MDKKIVVIVVLAAALIITFSSMGLAAVTGSAYQTGVSNTIGSIIEAIEGTGQASFTISGITYVCVNAASIS